MPADFLFRVLTRWHFRLLLMLLLFPAMTLCAADKRLAQSVPAALTHGNPTPLGRLPGTNQLRLTLDLPLRHTAELHSLLAAIYNPASPQFHHYLTPAEFAARFGPTPADYQAVMDFARTNGLTVTQTHQSRLLVSVTGKAADVERALHLKLYEYRHPTEARNFYAPDTGPTIDARLPLFHVSGLDNYSLPHPGNRVRPERKCQTVTPNGGSSPDGTYMGNDFRLAYVPGTALTGTGQNVALVQFDAFYMADITNYANLIGLTNSMPQVVTEPVDGGVANPGANVKEVTLDIDMVMSMAPGVSNIFVYEAPLGSAWLDILSQMADDDLAAQLSCSWSGGPPDPAAEQIFLQMAAQGQSCFVACGDTGAYADVVPFPCASPNVTEVGGTSLTTDTNGNYLAETVWNEGTGQATGGGVCPGVSIPPWQLGLDMTTNGGSTVCRNIPDVAMVSDGVYVIVSGTGEDTDGTSCGAPLWAGLTALINQQAAQLGQAPVGFLNPAIYGLCRGTNYAAVFNDITSGNNTNSYSSTNFYATPGFDLCTGWGSPAGTNLINALTTPDALGIVPPVELAASGFEGGPISQTNWTVTLTNSGVGPLDWSLSGVPGWLVVWPQNGTLDADSSTNIYIQLVNPNGLVCGDYYTVMFVTNDSLSRVQNVSVEVDVGQSIVQNGGFETGDFTGWTLVGQAWVGYTVYNAVGTDYDRPGLAHTGYFGAYLHEMGSVATLSQTLNTVPGQQYVVSYWLSSPGMYGTESFAVSWDGNTLTNLALADPPAFAWTNFQFVAMADDTNTVLQFAAQNDGFGFCLDDVSVTPVPLAIACYSVSTNGFQFTWPSRAGLNYLVQYTTDLTQGDWENLCTCPATTNFTSYVDTNWTGTDPQGFYRLTLAP
jgi:subtilase family serine protease